MIVDGESFALIEEAAEGLRLRLLPAEQVDAARTMDLPGGYCIGGVEFNTFGRRVAYHVFRQRPTDLFSTRPDTVRIPAENMLHLCRPLGAGQVRGVSWLAPVLLRLRELDVIEDALAKDVSVAALGWFRRIRVSAPARPTDPRASRRSGRPTTKRGSSRLHRSIFGLP